MRPVGEVDAVPGVLPALVDQARVGRRAGTRRSRRRRGHRAARSTPARGRRAGSSALDRSSARVAPRPQFAEQHDEQRRGVDACRSRCCPAEGELDVAAPNRISCRMRPGSSSRRRVDGGALVAGRGSAACRAPASGRSGSAIQDGQQRVPAEQRHEPGRAGRDHGPADVRRIEDPQRAEIVDAALQHGRQLGVVRPDTRPAPPPLPDPARSAAGSRAGPARRRDAPADGRERLQPHAPGAVRFDTSICQRAPSDPHCACLSSRTLSCRMRPPRSRPSTSPSRCTDRVTSRTGPARPSLTSNRSAKSASTASATSHFTVRPLVFRTDTVSVMPSNSLRLRMTRRLLSAPVWGGTRQTNAPW